MLPIKPLRISKLKTKTPPGIGTYEGKTVKERIYDHVHVSVRTMDIFIGVMVVLFVVVVVLGSFE